MGSVTGDLDAIAGYERALGLAKQSPERRFLERRIAELRRPR